MPNKVGSDLAECVRRVLKRQRGGMTVPEITAAVKGLTGQKAYAILVKLHTNHEVLRQGDKWNGARWYAAGPSPLDTYLKLHLVLEYVETHAGRRKVHRGSDSVRSPPR